MSGPAEEEIEALYRRLDGEAERSGYHLNPDREFTLGLVEGLLLNERRYGYRSCPCRLAEGKREEDLDIICPCDYRDPDLCEYGVCYCALYVARQVLAGRQKARRIPERRPPREGRAQHRAAASRAAPSGAPDDAPANGLPAEEGPHRRAPGLLPAAYPVWRCRVCGYLCAREEPPESCPICHAKKDRFETFTCHRE